MKPGLRFRVVVVLELPVSVPFGMLLRLLVAAALLERLGAGVAVRLLVCGAGARVASRGRGFGAASLCPACFTLEVLFCFAAI